MSLVLGDNFSYQANKPLDGRIKYNDVATMKAVADATMYDGCIAYCVATEKTYQWKSTNDVDETLGRWREFNSGGSGGTTDYSDLDNKPQIESVTLSGNKTASDLGLAKITDLADFITKTVDDLVNYYTKSQTYSKTEVDTIATAIKNSRFEAVATLPTSDIKTNVIYLVPKADAESGDIKDEYINLDGTTAGWERIGSTDIDLSGYVTTTALNAALANYTTTTDLTALLAGKQDKVQYSVLPTASAELEGKIFEYTGATGNGLTHGYFYECVSDGEDPATYSWQQTNVQPSGGGGSYTAGDGIFIENDEISIDPMPAEDVDEVIDIYPTAGNLVSIVNAFNKGDIYSTDEKMIGQWTSGKPLYQKTVSFGTLPNNTTKNVDINVSNIEKIVSCKGIAISSSSVLELPHVTTGDTKYFIEMYFSASKVYISTKYDYSSYAETYVTIQYTKTTDTAISIGEATEYSTDEKVVGTWIDGKPVYQKTVNIGTLPNNAFKEIDHNIPNISNIVDYKGIAIGSTTSILVGGNGNYANHLADIGLTVSNTQISVRTYNDRSAYTNTYITIQYTKTTT